VILLVINFQPFDRLKKGWKLDYFSLPDRFVAGFSDEFTMEYAFPSNHSTIPIHSIATIESAMIDRPLFEMRP
jgi:hypothetical protein